MYKRLRPTATTVEANTSYEGETIEQKIERIVNNKEPISDGAPLIYTERKNGVEPEYDIRTDRFEVAVEAMDKITKSNLAKRANRLKEAEEAKVVKMDKNQGGEKDGGAESIQGTESK